MCAGYDLASWVHINSAATHSHGVGGPPDPRSQAHAAARGYDLSDLRARLITTDAIARADIILVMDDRNLRDLQQLCALEHDAKLRRLSDFCHQLRCNTIPDPYRGSDSDFVHVLDLLEDACDGLAQHVLALKNGNRRSCAA